jgi:malate synthase
MIEGIEIAGQRGPGTDRVLTEAALEFVRDLHRQFDSRRRELLADRVRRQADFDAGVLPGFLPDTTAIREGIWRVAPPPVDLEDRRSEITGPTDRKMMINALNSGARVFMADFEDANSPTWSNMVEGQANVMDAVRRVISYVAPDGRSYTLDENPAVLMIRPRGWHLTERHVLVDGEPVSASLFDFGLFLFHNGAELLRRGSGPYCYLPKLESHLEARLWNDVFIVAQDRLGLAKGSVRATVLIETILAAFEMDEILYELRDHSAGLNAGRWDYIFSVIKKFRTRDDMVLPDRADVTMTVPFMRAYTDLLIATCHRRGAHAMGGMAAFIPSRRDPQVNELAFTKVREDKTRESRDGHDGTWVAHPDLVPLATEVFDEVLGDQPNQVDRQRPDVAVSADNLLFSSPIPQITRGGVEQNVDVAIRYLASWLCGNGAAGINHLMEDAATAEISRSQIWQWVHHGARLDDGPPITADLVREVADRTCSVLLEELGEVDYARWRFDDARRLFEAVALAADFPDFLTTVAYDHLEPAIITTGPTGPSSLEGNE